MESTLTIRFRHAEAEILDRLVRSGLFSSTSDVVRSALMNFGVDLGFIQRRDLWAAIESIPRRHATDPVLRRNVRATEDLG